jgi:hypothetical protein
MLVDFLSRLKVWAKLFGPLLNLQKFLALHTLLDLILSWLLRILSLGILT